MAKPSEKLLKFRDKRENPYKTVYLAPLPRNLQVVSCSTTFGINFSSFGIKKSLSISSSNFYKLIVLCHLAPDFGLAEGRDITL